MTTKEKKLLLYVDQGGEGKVPFPSLEDQIEISVFTYNTQRMGSAPTITASVMFPTCLDNKWNELGRTYTEFNGEKYYLKQTPTSSYSNEDSRYKHDLAFVSERVILDDVYFYDAVAQDEVKPDDKPLSNSTKFVFFGNIHDFSNRLNASLKHSGIDYVSVVDEGVSSEEQLISFEDQFFSNAIQESFNIYGIPYYFVGKTIHFGWSDDVLLPTFEYGVDNALLSITKNNADFKTINRVTGLGSSENIPYYYPNNSSKGDIEAILTSEQEDISVDIRDMELFVDKVGIDDSIRYTTFEFLPIGSYYSPYDLISFTELNVGERISFTTKKPNTPYSIYFRQDFTCPGMAKYKYRFQPNIELDSGALNPDDNKVSDLKINYSVYLCQGRDFNQSIWRKVDFDINEDIDVTIDKEGDYSIFVKMTIVHPFRDPFFGDITCKILFEYILESNSSWVLNDRTVELNKLGLVFNGDPIDGDTIVQKQTRYITTSEKLTPSIYRDSDGKERFYNAINGEYVDAFGNDVEFDNPFVEGNPKEHIVSFEDIKPTIKEATNEISWVEKNEKGEDVRVFQRIDMFSEFAYDEPDNDETYEDEEDNSDVKYKHSYFFAKLRKLPFNLFAHAIENEPMTITFTSGDVGACKFKIGVTEGFPQKNPVQVYENTSMDENGDIHERGTLKRDSEGRVVCGVHGDVEIQEMQQDTTKEEVWIALMKEEETYGMLMPKAPDLDENGAPINNGSRPKACTSSSKNNGDSFVILGINLPDEYIKAAEKRLDDELIKYMRDNNKEKFNFSITFSRVYLAQNPSIEEQLNENARINVLYNGTRYTLYIKSYSYVMSEGESLPDIRVELDENLSINQNGLQKMINEVKTDVGNAINNIDIIALGTPYFLRKDIDSEVQGNVNFKKGIRFGEGGKVEILDNNSAKLSIEYLEVTKKATFTSLEIQEKTHIGGQILITPAAANCGEVEEFDDFYRCYFQTKGEEGEEIFNQFLVGDLAICQTYNSWGSRYYWREVVGVGSYYIDLSKTLCDSASDAPMAGDKIIQLGNRSDATRQAAIVLSAHGDNSPSFIMYNGINDFSLEGKNITGVVWNPETQEPQMYSYGDFFFGDRNLENNFITFQNKKNADGTYAEEKTLHINADVTLGSDSTGLSNLSEFKVVEEKVNQVSEDTQYLSETFDKTVDIDGVVMSKFIAVKNDDGYVEAFMNGSNTFKDSTGSHGKLIIATGVQEGETETLPIRANNAKTRIYEDGTVHTNALHLHAGCTIGEDILLGEDANGVGYIKMGDIMSSSVGGLRIMGDGSLTMANKSANNKSQYIMAGGCNGYAMSIDVGGFGLHCSPNIKDVGLEVVAPNAWAHCVPNGLFAGLRTNTKVITTQKTAASPNVLDEYDFNVLITATTGTYHIKLPSTPLDGQEYWLETFGADIYVYSDVRMWSHAGAKYETSHQFASRGTIRFKYYAGASTWTYTWVESLS